MLIRRAPLLLTAALVMFCGGCSFVSDSTTDAVDSRTAPRDPVKHMTLFISKKTREDVPFEQYTLQGASVFRECGKIRRGRSVPVSQEFVTLSGAQQAKLADAIATLDQAISESKSTFDKPGDNQAIWDPGKLLFSFKNDSTDRTINTSVESIALPKTIPQEKLKFAVRAVREVASASVCGNGSFFGLTTAAQQQ